MLAAAGAQRAWEEGRARVRMPPKPPHRRSVLVADMQSLQNPSALAMDLLNAVEMEASDVAGTKQMAVGLGALAVRPWQSRSPREQ
eukprot:SAG31_NODE_66_length_28567_cov_30.222698_5_plen_86_part_00